MAVENELREFQIKLIVRQAEIRQQRHGQETGPIRRHKLAESKVKMPYLSKICNLRRDGATEIAVEKTQILKLR